MKTVWDDGPDGDEVDEDDLDYGPPVVLRTGGGEASHGLESVQSYGRQTQGGDVNRGALGGNCYIKY